MKKLKIKYRSVDGWSYSGGRSNNIWGQVPTSNLPLHLINHSIMQGKKSCIWTCYDEQIYKKNETSGRGNLMPVKLEDLPKTISATFKPTYSRFSVIAENLGMRIAVALDLPTSYNYIVKFDFQAENSGFKSLLKHLNERDIKNLQPYGIVSIDFLKPANDSTVFLSTTYSGERLVSFEESMKIADAVYSDSSEKSFLVKNWLKSMCALIRDKKEQYLPDISQEKLEEQIRCVKSRVVRSFLLREFLGDCDFTDRNSGFIFDSKAQNLQFAPNFDYGESFNALIKTKLDYLPSKEEIEFIIKWDKDYLKRKEEKSKIPVEVLASQLSSSSSEENIKYIVENYKEDTKEFLTSLKNLMANKEILDNLIDDYTKSEKNTPPLLTHEEANIFKSYIRCRANWFINRLENNIKNDKQLSY